MGILHVVATPIGNLEDISARALRVLREVTLIAAEDTRHSGRLLAHHGITTPMMSYHAFNERQRRERLLTALASGDIALISDAGTPGISDPGQDLVAAAVAAGFTVSPVPGPSAPIAAVSASGLVRGPYIFLGFLPRASRERQLLVGRAAASGFPIVLFEAPNRVAATLTELLPMMGTREAAVFRELTKLHEGVRRGTLDELASVLAGETIKGEVVVVIGERREEIAATDDPRQMLTALLASGMKPSIAAREAASLTGKPRAELYELARQLSTGRPDPAAS